MFAGRRRRELCCRHCSYILFYPCYFYLSQSEQKWPKSVKQQIRYGGTSRGMTDHVERCAYTARRSTRKWGRTVLFCLCQKCVNNERVPVFQTKTPDAVKLFRDLVCAPVRRWRRNAGGTVARRSTAALLPAFVRRSGWVELSAHTNPTEITNSALTSVSLSVQRKSVSLVSWESQCYCPAFTLTRLNLWTFLSSGGKTIKLCFDHCGMRMRTWRRGAWITSGFPMMPLPPETSLWSCHQLIPNTTGANTAFSCSQGTIRVLHCVPCASGSEVGSMQVYNIEMHQ